MPDNKTMPVEILVEFIEEKRTVLNKARDGLVAELQRTVNRVIDDIRVHVPTAVGRFGMGRAWMRSVEPGKYDPLNRAFDCVQGSFYDRQFMSSSVDKKAELLDGRKDELIAEEEVACAGNTDDGELTADDLAYLQILRTCWSSFVKLTLLDVVASEDFNSYLSDYPVQPQPKRKKKPCVQP